ncbi:MAG TPA: hypothetical protein VGF06_18000, partial [Terriglobales bacterium]
MSEPRPKSRWRKLGKFLLFNFIAVLLACAGLLWYATTDSFRGMVQRRLTSELEKVTGGKVEIGHFDLAPLRLRAELTNLTVHGREAVGEVPFVHVQRLAARVNVISVFGAQYGFHWVVLDHPTVHIIVYPDGTTNYPGAQVQASGDSLQRLFDLSISRLDVRHGILLLNEQRIPLDFSVNDLDADMQRSLLSQRYQGEIRLGKAETHFDGYRPVAWTAEAHFALAQNLLELNSLKASAHGAHLDASGRVENFHQPNGEATYRLDLDLAEAAAIARRPEIRKGSLLASGKGSWTPQAFSTSGNLSITDLSGRNPELEVRHASLNAQFAVSQEKLALSQIQARLLGGDVAGNVEIANWLAK